MKLLIDMNLSPLWLVVGVLRQYTTLLETGAIISVDEASARVRILPLIP